MSSLGEQIKALNDRIDLMDLAIWGLETSEKRHWKLIKQISDKVDKKSA